MNTEDLLVEGAIGLVAVLLATVAYALVSAVFERRRFANRLQMASGQTASASLESRIASSTAGVRGAIERIFTALGALMPLGQEDRAKITTALNLAGFRSPNAVTVVLGTKFASFVCGLAIGTLFFNDYQPGALGWLIGIGIGFFVGVILNLLPELVVNRLANRRRIQITSALPEMYDLLIVSLEAGLTFERALRRTVDDLKTFNPTLAAELGQASLDMSVHGRSRDEALRRVAERLDSQDIRDLATTVAQAERHGTPTADALRKLASSARVETLARVQANIARLPTLMVLPSVGLLLPGFMLIVGGPAILQLVSELQRMGGGL